MYRTLSILTIAVLTLAPAALLRAEDRPEPMAIDQLVVQALSQNPEIRFYESEIVAAKAGRRTAGRLGNPELDLEIGQKRARGGDFSAEGIAYSVSLAQPVEWPGRIGLRKAIANGDITEDGGKAVRARAGSIACSVRCVRSDGLRLGKLSSRRF